MKKILVSLALILAGVGYSQTPNAINYQAVARDGAGLLMAGQAIDVRIGIYSGVGAANLEYEETHAVTTNQYGQFALKIGAGMISSGTFAGIAWDGDEHHLRVEVDPGSGYVDLGTSQLVSVPYAMHSTTSTHAVTADVAGPWALNGTNAYYDNGYVGIGTSTPDMPLSVHTSSGISYIRVSDNTTGPSSGLRMGMSGGGNAYIINDEATSSLSLGTEGTSQMRITDLGRVGINELTPEMMLHIKQDAANRGFRIEHQTATDHWDNGIGTTTKNYKFYYNDLFRADISSVDGAYTQSSDRRLKKDIVYMGSVLERIMQLKPATYNYIDNEPGSVRSTGFVAQEVADVFPNLVRDMEDGYKGVVYDGFAVVSIRAIQELNEKVTQLKKEIEILKQEINK